MKKYILILFSLCSILFSQVQIDTVLLNTETIAANDSGVGVLEAGVVCSADAKYISAYFLETAEQTSINDTRDTEYELILTWKQENIVLSNCSYTNKCVLLQIPFDHEGSYILYLEVWNEIALNYKYNFINVYRYK